MTSTSFSAPIIAGAAFEYAGMASAPTDYSSWRPGAPAGPKAGGLWTQLSVFAEDGSERHQAAQRYLCLGAPAGGVGY